MTNPDPLPLPPSLLLSLPLPLPQNAGRGSTAFHTVLFFKENPAEAEDAYILRILETRLIVLVPRFGIEVWTEAGREGMEMYTRHYVGDMTKLSSPLPFYLAALSFTFLSLSVLNVCKWLIPC